MLSHTHMPILSTLPYVCFLSSHTYLHYVLYSLSSLTHIVYSAFLSVGATGKSLVVGWETWRRSWWRHRFTSTLGGAGGTRCRLRTRGPSAPGTAARWTPSAGWGAAWSKRWVSWFVYLYQFSKLTDHDHTISLSCLKHTHCNIHKMSNFQFLINLHYVDLTSAIWFLQGSLTLTRVSVYFFQYSMM